MISANTRARLARQRLSQPASLNGSQELLPVFCRLKRLPVKNCRRLYRVYAAAAADRNAAYLTHCMMIMLFIRLLSTKIRLDLNLTYKQPYHCSGSDEFVDSICLRGFSYVAASTRVMGGFWLS